MRIRTTLLSLLLAAFAATAQAQPRQTTIDPSRRLQQNEGWGVSLCWWANMLGRWTDEAALDTLVDRLVSPNHLNYNIFRYNIGGGDDPLWRNCPPHHFAGPPGKGERAEMPGFKDAADDEFHWDRDEAQRRVMLKIRERRPDAIFEAFSNSPPYYMTASGCAAGAATATDDNLLPAAYAAFADYLVSVCLFYRDSFNLEFRTLEPFNEPVTDYWYAGGSQEGCHFSPEAQVRFLRVLAPRLQASGLRTRISASDETSIAQSAADFRAYAADSAALQAVWQWNTHSYKGTDADRIALRQLVRGAGKRLWMSESGDGGWGLHGNLQMAQRLIRDIRLLQPDAWVDWQYVEEFGDQWSLVRSDWNRERWQFVKNYYVRYHFTHFIRQGYTYLETDNPQLLAAVSPDDRELVIVVINPSKTTKNAHSIEYFPLFGDAAPAIRAYRTSHSENVDEIADFASDGRRLTFQLPPLSIATFVLRRP